MVLVVHEVLFHCDIAGELKENFFVKAIKLNLTFWKADCWHFAPICLAWFINQQQAMWQLFTVD